MYIIKNKIHINIIFRIYLKHVKNISNSLSGDFLSSSNDVVSSPPRMASTHLIKWLYSNRTSNAITQILKPISGFVFFVFLGQNFNSQRCAKDRKNGERFPETIRFTFSPFLAAPSSQSISFSSEILCNTYIYIYISNWICGDSYLISLLFLYVESTKRGTCERCGGRPSANRRYGVGYTSHSFDFCKTQNYNPWKGTFVYFFFFFLFKFFIHIWVSFIFALVS